MWIATLCHKIIICILLLTLKIKTGHISTSRRRMATTLGRLDPLVTWSHEATWLIKTIASTRAMTGKIGKVEVYSKRPPSIDFFYALITWQSYHVADGKHYIATSAGPMANKLDRVVGSSTALLSIKSHNLLITWSYKVTWQMKNVINSFSRDLSLSRLFKGIPEFLESGLWTLDSGLWTLGSGLWTLDSGL